MLSLTLAIALSAAPAATPPKEKPTMSVHAFTVKSNQGQDVALSSYAGKALLIVNTASECGYTPQYKGMQALYEKYKARGLEILAFPSNDFGAQEPGSDADIKKFCELKFKTTFPLFSKVPVKGAGAIPLYKHLTSQKAAAGDVRWNFTKFLVDGKGEVVGRFEPSVAPESPELAAAVEKLLGK
jgi:glutathione peroxidase